MCAVQQGSVRNIPLVGQAQNFRDSHNTTLVILSSECCPEEIRLGKFQSSFAIPIYICAASIEERSVVNVVS